MVVRLLRLMAVTAAAVALTSPTVSASPGNDELIVYAAGDNDLYEVSSAGGVPIQLTSGDDLDQLPAWSPDHQTIAFTRQVGTGRQRLFTMQPTGTDIRRVTGGRCDAFAPSWSPSGNRIAFIQECHYVDRAAILNLGTGRVHRVTAGWTVAWSPNGRWLAVVAADRHQRPVTYLVHPDGSHRHRLATTAGSLESPDWSPDGSWLAVDVIDGTGPDLTSDIAIVHPNGRGFRRITKHHAGNDGRPKWSPDGTRLVFIRNAFDSTGHQTYSRLLIMRIAAGSAATAIASGDMPDW